MKNYLQTCFSLISLSITEIAEKNTYIGAHLQRIDSTEEIFNPDDPNIKQDIIRMIIQYLNDEGYHASKMTVSDEANIKWHEKMEQQAEIVRLKKVILDGDWTEVDKLCSKNLVKNQKSFLYAVYKQQYLEYIEHREMQKAFTFLTKRLKPLEHLQTTPNEFKDLCYLLTAKSIHDAASFKNWEGIGPAREKLVEQLQNRLDSENFNRDSANSTYVPPNRLVTLLRQAVSYQMEFARYHPRITPIVNTLLEDYSSFIIPNAVFSTFTGHRGNIKCVEFIGEEGSSLISGSSDNTLRIWNTETTKCTSILEGHTSRIWDVSSNKKGSLVASASGDRTVKLWDIKHGSGSYLSTFSGHEGDVYSVKFHPGGNHFVTGGYDKVVRLFDINTGAVVKTFTGHQLAVSKTIFNPLGNLIISGSKDNTIKFWDVVSGLCIRTITQHLGEVTSVEINSSGNLLLSSSKDNSNRLWDIRMVRPIQRLKGHQNTSKNFIRAGFAHNNLVAGGSEDGIVYIWDQKTGEVLQKLRGHSGIVYNAVWNDKQSLFCSCSDDRTLKTWWYDENKPITCPNDSNRSFA
ncbi:WD40 repeat-like protein [Basidiobolus meristosporus CBS 931.73]|uniref:WD40 repeat-containing protein SMU1 n=1 Tax=Basidiobolus meristosporus CBS 931.73 TaxID=1314790 RepID=A0A1Y1XXH5_9FUNG|nr:WD40 repeat-like protein [Basidiobolus meristosporus CBS 931.73]|eukprot:ORX90453.1 WD40 repeat-like protein [Basidiobolus meristosporus CBS 931.73]